MNEFQEAFSLANLIYGLDISPETFEEIGLIAWSKIGNKEFRLYRYSSNIDKETLSLELPCNCDEIEAVTYGYEEWKYTTNDTVNGNYASLFTTLYIEGRKLYEDPFYAKGKYVKYHRAGDTLYFDKDYGRIFILYKGVLLDDSGLPYLSENEVNAISCYCAYVTKFKEALATHNPTLHQEAQILETKWLKLCDEARIPSYLNQNDMNKILDAKTSWGRKYQNYSFKPVR